MSAVATYRDVDLHHARPALPRPVAERSATLAKPGMFRRMLDALTTSRQCRAERQIAEHFGLSDGYLTDEIERRISQHFMGGGSFRP